jgi:hypothetical protein
MPQSPQSSLSARSNAAQAAIVYSARWLMRRREFAAVAWRRGGVAACGEFAAGRVTPVESMELGKLIETRHRHLTLATSKVRAALQPASLL